MKPFTDEAYDALCDGLAVTERCDREYPTPSAFPTSSAFVRAASHPTVAVLLPATTTQDPGGNSSAARAASVQDEQPSDEGRSAA